MRALAVGAAAGAAAFAVAAPAPAGGEERPIRGWLEHAHIEPGGIRFDAKLDTGARTSSIHAEILRSPETDGRADAQIAAAEEEAPLEAPPETDVAIAAFAPDDEDETREEVEVEEVEQEDETETIVFRVTNEEGESSTLQREIVRWVEIKTGDDSTDRRPVVELTVCIAGVWVTGEVNLADREDFNYPFLVGRNMLESSGIIVDAREIYTRSARCPSLAP